MKKLFFILVSILMVVPVLADNLVSAPETQAIGQYQGFWENAIEPANHVVWKLYVFRAIPDSEDPKGEMKYIIAGLTSFPKSSYYVRIRIDLLYNYLKTTPKRGDVLIVSGRVMTRQNYLLNLTNKETPVKILTMQLDGAVNLRQEHFDPAATVVIPVNVIIDSTPTIVLSPDR